MHVCTFIDRLFRAWSCSRSSMLSGLFCSPPRKDGRVTLPAEWRPAFGERIVVTASLEEPGLLFWPVASLEAFERAPGKRTQWRFLLAAAAELSVRANGSFRIPKRYRAIAGAADTLFSKGDHALWTDGQRYMRSVRAFLQSPRNLGCTDQSSGDSRTIERPEIHEPVGLLFQFNQNRARSRTSSPNDLKSTGLTT